MFKIDTVGNVNGAFAEENIGTGQQPTVVSAEWLNAVQNELLAVVLASGGVPSKANSAQVVASINALISVAIANLVNSSPTSLDTLKELATALGNDANFATTVTNALAGKAPLGGVAGDFSVGGTLKLNGGGFMFSPDAGQDTGIYWESDGVMVVRCNSLVVGRFNAGGFTGGAGSVAWGNVSGKPTTLGGYGITDASQFGVGQTKQNVTASRVLGTIYTNTTGKLITISGYCTNLSNGILAVVVAGQTVWYYAAASAAPPMPFYAEVAPGETYSVTPQSGSLTLANWVERR